MQENNLYMELLTILDEMKVIQPGKSVLIAGEMGKELLEKLIRNFSSAALISTHNFTTYKPDMVYDVVICWNMLSLTENPLDQYAKVMSWGKTCIVNFFGNGHYQKKGSTLLTTAVLDEMLDEHRELKVVYRKADLIEHSADKTEYDHLIAYGTITA